jgi:flagellar basal body P-ring formation protein FlgA
MKQASDSLLTFNQIPFTASSAVPALPRVKVGTINRHLTPFNFHWKSVEPVGSILPDLSCSPRSFVRSWLGEERIRSLFYGIHFVLLAVIAGVFSIRIAPGAENLSICLRESASVHSGTIFLKDVADLRGSDLQAIEALSNISLGASPEFGSVKTLSRHQIDECIKAADGPVGNEKISGASAVQVRMKGKPIEPDAIAAMLKAYILKTSSWKESEIEIRSIGNLNGMELPPDNAELRFSPSAVVLGYRNIMAPIEIAQAGKTLRCFWITAEVVIHADAWVAAEKILPGEIVESSNFVKKSALIENFRAAYIHTLDEVVGKIARRNFSPGDLVTREAFTDPFLIKKGETVQLRLERNGIMLTSRARAEQNGRLGQVIRVRNLEFSTVLKAQVTGQSQVVLQ